MLRAVLDPNTKKIVYKDDGIGAGTNLPQAPNAAPGEISLSEISVGGASLATPAVPSSSGSTGGGMMRLPYGDYLAQLEKDRGLPAGYLAQTRSVESSNGKNLANPNSSARGDFQFITSTARKYGVDVNDRYSSARGAADLAADNAGYFQKRFGRNPTGAELYGMHQQGAVGYGNLMDGQAPGGAAQALNGGAGMSASQFRSKLASIYSNAKPDLPGDPTAKAQSSGSANQPVPAAIAPQMPTATSPAAAPAYNGGLVGLLSSENPGADAKSIFSQGSGFASAAKGLMGALAGSGGGRGGKITAPGIQPMSEADSQNTPNMQLLQMLYGKGFAAYGGAKG